jgi:hypothetical protein
MLSTNLVSNDLYQSSYSSIRKFTLVQCDVEPWPRIGAKHTDLIFIQGYFL